MRLGQSATEAATPTRALPLATRTEIVVVHAAEKRSDDQWYKSMSRSSPAKATHVLKHLHALLWDEAARAVCAASGELPSPSAQVNKMLNLYLLTRSKGCTLYSVNIVTLARATK